MKFIHNHLMSIEFGVLIALLVVSILTGSVIFVMCVSALFAFWLWWIIRLIATGVREELRKENR